MGAINFLRHLRESGFVLDVAADKLMVTPASSLTDELRTALRECKPELIALLTGESACDRHDDAADQRHEVVVGRSCTDCLHLLKRGNCGRPVAAGLANNFSIAWPPAGHGADCPAFDAKAAINAIKRPYRLSKTQGDACHAPEWDGAEIARFTARRDRLLGWGYSTDDAGDLAERLHLRDLEGDDRRMCVECVHAVRGLRCALNQAFLATQLQRCPAFTSTESVP